MPPALQRPLSKKFHLTFLYFYSEIVFFGKKTIKLLISVHRCLYRQARLQVRLVVCNMVHTARAGRRTKIPQKATDRQMIDALYLCNAIGLHRISGFTGKLHFTRGLYGIQVGQLYLCI